jgi:tetratricopeptide (TPR) repeat protein
VKFLKLFSGKTPEDHEAQGDAFFQAEAFGAAKIEYEKALDKIEKKGVDDADYTHQLEHKRSRSMEALALEHLQRGGELIETLHLEEAEELLHLALELSKNDEVVEAVNKKLLEVAGRLPAMEGDAQPEKSDFQEEDNDWPDPEDPVPHGSDEEVLTALFGSLPEEEQTAYRRYGAVFEQGYIALNQGDFEIAAVKLSQALEDHSSSETFIPLELATAYMNLGNTEEAQSLLTQFLGRHPESLKAYHLLCDILWENRDFDGAWQLLLSCSRELSNSLNIFLLKGETLLLAGKYNEAESLDFYYLYTNGWDEHIAQSLGKTYEALGLNDKARELYEEIIGACQGCGSRVDPYVKQRYADTSLETGHHSVKILEIYFDLIKEDPDNRRDYYDKVSRIYTLQGNKKEARRYLAMAEAFK